MQDSYSYSGEVTYGPHDDRVYIDTLEYSLNKHIFDDFRGKEVIIEMWVTTDRMDYYALEKMTDITPENMSFFRMYTQYRTTVTKKTMLDFFGNTKTINNSIGHHLFCIVSEVY